MSGINVCATNARNMGRPGCDYRMGRIKYLGLSVSKEFTEAELETSEGFETALQNAMLLANGNANKIFLFPEMRDVTNNTGDPNTGALADGFEEVLNEALPKYLLKSTPGICVQQAMASYNGWAGKLFFIDENNVLLYKTKTNGGGKMFNCGYLYTNPPSPKGSGDVQTANTRVTFGSIDDFKSNVGALKLDFNPADLTQMQDVILTDEEDENVSGALNNTFLIGAKTRCDETNLYTTYKDLLTLALWRAYQSDGTALSLSGVTPIDGSSAWQVVMTYAVYNALPTGTVFYIDLVPPVTLRGSDIDGLEAVKIRFVKL